MKIPFTVDQFLSVFEHYNQSIWPMQIILYLVALAGIFFLLKNAGYTDQLIPAILTFLWLWMGIVYHLIFFTAINEAAYLFGLLFIIQAVLFLSAGVFKSRLNFKFSAGVYGLTGGLFLLYALIIYPVLGYMWGHVYPRSPTFGAPCPTTIFTFGLLLFTVKKVPKYLLLIPLLWSLIGSSAAVNLSVKEDFGLLAAGVLGTVLIVIKDRKKKDTGVKGDMR